MKNEDLNYTTVATKLSKTDKAKFMSIAEGFGMTFYQLVQAMYLCLLRYFDKDSLISYEHNAMINAFGYILGGMGKDSFCLVSRKGCAGDTVTKAILFVERPKRNGQQLLMVGKRKGKEATENYNQDTMLCEFLRCVDQDTLRALEREKRERGYFSILQTLHELILQRVTPVKDTLQEEISEMFSDVRTSTGEAINDNTYYQKRHHKQNEDCLSVLPQKRRLLAEF